MKGAPSEVMRRMRRLACGRSLAVGTLGLAALVLSLVWLDRHTPLQDWLVWTLLTIWGWQLVLAVAMAMAGHAVVVGLLGVRPRSLAELVAVAVPVGAMVFVLGIFVAGFLGALRSWLAVAWPLGMVGLALGSDRTRPAALGPWLRQHWPRPGPRDPFRVLATAFGVLAVGLVYLQTLSPTAVTYDAAWTHLVIAQDYARAGRIVPFLADWPKNLPHLGSVINTWSFLVPGLPLPAMKWMMALHTELVFFLWTLVAMAATMARLGGYRPGAWAALFLFPATFVYDHCLGGGADRFLAFWSVPVLLALLEIVATRSTRWWIVLATLMAGAVMTKGQAVLLVAPTAVVLAVVVARDLRKRRPGPWRGPLAAAATALVLTAPHFGANLVYHHNPFYPFAQDTFTASTPTLPDAALFANNLLRDWGAHPPGPLGRKVATFLEAVATIPCHPHVPESGTLFVVALLLLPFLPRAQRLWLAAVFAVGTVATWSLTYQMGRNLEGILPVVAAVTGAVLVRALALGRWARLGVAALLLVQVGAGLDWCFAEGGRMDSAVALIRSARKGRAHERFAEFQRDHIELGRSLPPEAVVLLHTKHTNLGIDRPILFDGLGFQGLIDPRTFRTARDLYQRLVQLGVTHVVYEHNGRSAETRQGEAVFDVLAASQRSATRSFGGLRLFALPAAAPPVEPDYEVLLLSMSDQSDGLYAVADLDTVETLPGRLRVRKAPRVALGEQPAAALLGRARVVLRGRDGKLDDEGARHLGERFEEVASYDGFTVYVRKP